MCYKRGSQLVSACGPSPMSSLSEPEPEPSMLAGVNLYRMYPVSRKLCHCTVIILCRQPINIEFLHVWECGSDNSLSLSYQEWRSVLVSHMYTHTLTHTPTHTPTHPHTHMCIHAHTTHTYMYHTHHTHHTHTHAQKLPPKKDFIRGVSYITGFVIRAKGTGCALTYVTQSDPRGVCRSYSGVAQDACLDRTVGWSKRCV